MNDPKTYAREVSRYYYFKTEEENDIEDDNVVNFTVRDKMIRLIIEALGRACGVADNNLIDQIERATILFKQAA